MIGLIITALSLTLRINNIYEIMDQLVDKAEDQALEQPSLRDILK